MREAIDLVKNQFQLPADGGALSWKYPYIQEFINWSGFGQ
jgi:hypothetical protein